MIGVLSIIAAALLVSLSSVGLIAILRVKGGVSSVLAFFTAACATVVLLAEILSELHVVQRSAFLIGHLLIAAVLFPWTFKSLRTLFRKGLPQALRQGWRTGCEVFADPVLAVLGLFVVATMALGAYLIMVAPPNTWDVLAYHLSRVGHWLHNGTLRHFETPNAIRTMYPINAEIGLLWLTALWGSDRLAGSVQWLAAVVIAVSIYGTARRLRFPRPASMFAALTWNTFTIVVTQATSSDNDLAVAAFCSVAFYFLLDGLRETSRGWNASLALFGLSIGLAGGAKFTALFILPGVGFTAIFLIFRDRRQFFSKLAPAACWCLVGFALLGAYNYVLNWGDYGAIGGPKSITDAHSIQNPSLATFGANIGRIGYHFVDPGGLPDRVIDVVQVIRPAIGRKVFALLRIEPNPPETLVYGTPFDFDSRIQLVPRDDASWYGPLGFLLLWPVVFYYLFISPFRQRDSWKWSTALTVFLYVLMFAVLLRWQPWIGRMFLAPVAIGSPLMAGFYVWSEQRKVLRWGVLAIALAVSSWSSTHNLHKPVFGATPIWNMDYYELRTIQEPAMGPIYRAMDENIPQTARLGVMGPWPAMRWDYLYFGPNLERTLVFLGSEVREIHADFFAEAQIDYLVVATPTPDTLKSEVQLRPLGYGWGLYWFWAQGSAMEK